MSFDVVRARQYLHDFDFKKLFVEVLGWDYHRLQLPPIQVDGIAYTLNALVEKRGLVTFICDPDPQGRIPGYAVRRKIEKKVAKSVHEHFIIYIDAGRTTQTWQWVKREAGKPDACREHTYYRDQSGDSLLQKLQTIAFDLEEEETLIAATQVAARIRQGFYAERVTKRFYERFKNEHDAFLGFILGIPDADMQRWYASIMLNRLMFIYFIQKKGFLNDDPDYLRHKLTQSREGGPDRYYRVFLCPLFFEGFAKQETDRAPDINLLLGKVPYLNGGIFTRREMETPGGRDLQIADAAFEKIFNFFDEYRWHLDERPLRRDDEINPDVLGYIFEKYINQKQMGAYYTKEDITEYIAKSTIIPFLFDAAERKCAIALRPEGAVWGLLREDPDRYIYDAVKHGLTVNIHAHPPEPLPAPLPLPPEIAAGLADVAQRTGWNKTAPPEYALPTETWREVVARRKRYEKIRAKLTAGEIYSINDLITCNLDLRQFAQDVMENCEGPELLRAFYYTLAGRLPRKSHETFQAGLSVLDPTCGSGAFLFAALNILEPLYEACLGRMAAFVQDLDRDHPKPHPEKFADFREVLADIDKHPSPRYFILKSIIIHNLFGVDLMPEAVEICKLRFFLKLAAQVEDVAKMEPLPDIDFNIRAGNTLVGFAGREDVRRASVQPQTGQVRLAFGEEQDAMARIDEKAEICDRAYQRFRLMQTRHDMDPGDFAAAKEDLRLRLSALAGELDRYLAGEYGINQNIFPKKKEYEQRLENWRTSHQPFHWFSEFYGIIKSGGFDVIIGNPPYLNLKDLNEYVVTGFVTLPARNLFPLILERCQKLIDKFGHQGYIVFVASIATEGYISLQNILIQKKLTFSSYDDRPSHLFDGLDKNTLSILLFSEKENKGANEVFSTRLSRWNAEERDMLFPLLEYNSGSVQTLNGCIPKIGSNIEASIWNKLFIKSDKLSAFYSTSQNHVVFYSRKVNAFLQILDFIPEVRDGKGNTRMPSEFKTIYFSTKIEALSVYCLFNSTLFRWFMDVVSDGSHLNRREIDNFPFNPKSAIKKFPQLESIAYHLSENLLSTSEVRVMRYKHDTLTIQCIIPKFSKGVINQIDNVLAQYYGFTDEELDFIINYDIKYRLGAEAEGD
jgi:hypothetical protein